MYPAFYQRTTRMIKRDINYRRGMSRVACNPKNIDTDPPGVLIIRWISAKISSARLSKLPMQRLIRWSRGGWPPRGTVCVHGGVDAADKGLNNSARNAASDVCLRGINGEHWLNLPGFETRFTVTRTNVAKLSPIL